jgi:hypothetical protein
MKTFTRLLVAVAATVLAPGQASACAVCMGDPNTKLAGATNGLMFFLLGVLAMVFCLMGTFAYMIFRQAKAPMPPHAELGEGIDPQPSGF